jgi:NAD+ kinase
MSYTIRDLISAGVWPDPKGLEPRGFASKIEVKSRCFEGGIVIDGGVFFKFNEGTTATLEIHNSDALRTVKLIET